MKDTKTGTLDDLIEAAVPAVVAKDSLAQKFEAVMASAPPVVDIQTGIGLKPGDPEHCWGRGYYYPDFERCCDGCNFYLACYPDAMPT